MKIKLKSYITFLLLSLVPIDFISGFFVYHDIQFLGLTFGQITRAIILVINLLLIFKLSKKSMVAFLGIIIFFMISFFTMYFVNAGYSLKGTYDLFGVLTLYFYFLYVLILVTLLRQAMRHGIVDADRIIKLSCDTALMCALVILASYFFNFGFNTYKFDDVFRGYFKALNPTVAILISGYGFMFYKLTKKFSVLMLLKILIVMSTVLMTGTKSFIASVIVIPLIWLLVSNKLSFKKLGLVIAIAFLAVIVYNFFGDSTAWNNITTRLAYFYSRSSLLSFLLSHRNDYLLQNIPIIKENPLIFLLGFPNKQYLIEMDFFDVIFYYGAVGIFVIYTGISWLVKILKCLFRENEYVIIFATALLMLFISFFSGHMLFQIAGGSALANVFVVAVDKQTELTQVKTTQIKRSTVTLAGRGVRK